MKKYVSLLSIVLLSLAAFWGFYDLIPSSVANVKSASHFSVDKALGHLKMISKKTHHVGTLEHKKVQTYVFNELEKIGLNPSIQYQTVFNRKWFAGTTTENILARIPGSEKGKALMLLTHYDSSPHSAKGASDAGSGVVTILEGIQAFLANNQQPKNDIIILISDAEELGLLGAKAFVDHHPWAKDVGLVLNFEARGSGGPSYMLMETNGQNKKMISEFLKAKPNYPAANSLMYSVYKMLPNDTDLTVFREEGNINGFNFAFIGDHFDYHTAQDSYERLDRETLQHQADYLMSTLNYFAFSDLSNFESVEDHVYVNFPILKMLNYPFSWVIPMLVICFIVFLVLIFFGIGLNRLILKSIFIGFIPLILSILIGGGFAFLFWEAILIIHPDFKDMLHGFTYNGYWYIATIAFFSIWLTFNIYKPFIKKDNKLSLFIAPIFIWLVVNFGISRFLEGAGFFIFPVISSLLILASEIFKKTRKKRVLFYALFSIPTLYIFAPMVKIFPVGLGLKMLFISALFIALLFGLLLPILTEKGARKGFARLSGLLAIVFFSIATWKSGFDVNNKKPNSLVYIKNVEDNSAIWGSYNHVLDDYTNQKLGENSVAGGIANAETLSKYNTRFRYYQQAEILPIENSIISIISDTLMGNQRNVSLSILPQRKIHKYELRVNDSVQFHKVMVNTALVNEGKAFKVRKGTFLIYHMGNSDEDLQLNLSLDKNASPAIILNEISYDLLENEIFDLKPRTDNMLPMPFVTNDAVIITQQIKL